MWSEVPSRSEACLPLRHRQVFTLLVSSQASLARVLWFASSWRSAPQLGRSACDLGASLRRGFPRPYDWDDPRTELTADIIASTPTSSVFVLIPAPKASLPSHRSRTYAIAEASEPVPSASEL